MSQHMLIPVEPGDIRLHVPLAQSIYDAHGRLLLRRGLVVETPHYLEHLASVGMKEKKKAPSCVDDETDVHSVFEEMENVAVRLSRLYQRLREHADYPECMVSVGKIADAILACCAKDGDAAFAVTHLDRHHDYETVHHLMAGVICARIAMAERWGKAQRRTVVAAVLTQDIALLPHRRLLDAGAGLTAEQWLIVNGHPEESARWIERLGVRDETWLRCIRHHHRRLDGSGYPSGGDEPICAEACVAMLADTLSAMLRPRPYRGRIPATKALAELYANTQGRYDAGIINCLIRELGIFPPGSLVRLANGETGIVVRNRPDHLYAPDVWALADAKGYLLQQPSPREIGDPDCAIASLRRPENCHSVMRTVAGLWDIAPTTPKPPASAPATQNVLQHPLLPQASVSHASP